MPLNRASLAGTLGFLCLCLSFSGRLSAERTFPAEFVAQKSHISGSVYDEKSQPLPGVVVHIGALAGKKLSLRTDVHGKFSAGLDPGEYYIWLSRAGFEPVVGRIMDIHEGENRPRFVLRASHDKGLRRLLNTVAPPTASQGALPRQTRSLEKKQSTRDVPDVSQALVDRYGEMRTPGAQVSAGRYLIDSSNQSQPRDFGLTNVNATSIQDLQIQRSTSGIAGIEPDYVSPGKELRFESVVREGRWGFGLHDLFPTPQIQRGVRLGDWSPKLGVDGPLGQRVWISDTLSADHTVLVIPELPRNADSIEAWKGTNTLRSQIQLNPNHLIGSSLVYSLADDSHVGLTSFTPLATTVNIRSQRLAFSGYDQHSFGNTILETGLGLEKLHSTLSPQGGTPYILYPGSAAGSYFETLIGEKHHAQVYVAVRRGFATAIGKHDLQIGVDTTATEYHHDAKRRPFQIVDAAGLLQQATDFIGNSDFALRNIRTGAYVQDAWRLGSRVRMEGGLRWTDDTLMGQLALSPRASISFLPTPARKTKVFVFWGIYYPDLNLALLGQAEDQLRIDKFYNNGVPAGPPQTDDFVADVPKLRAPHYESYKTGVEQQLGRSTFIAGSLIWRYQLDGLAYKKLAAYKDLEQIALLNDRRDSYRAVEVSLRHDFGSAAEVFGSYTRSHTFSNQLFDFDLSSQTYTSQYQGPLDYDAPNRVVAWAWAPVLHRRFILSYLFEYRTGFPFTAVDQAYDVVGIPNSLRFPDFLRLNLGVEKIFDFHGRAIGVRFAAVNITNHRNPIAVDNNVDSPNFMHFDGGLRRTYAVRVRLLETR